MQFSFVADRFQYLAGAGVTTVIAAAAARAAVRLPRAAAAGVAGAVLLALGILTWRQAGVWRDNVTLNSHILGLNPRARGAHHNLGKGLLDRGRPQESIAATRVALERHPVLSGLDLDPGAALLVEDLGGETAGQLRRAAALDPSYAEVHVNLALAFTELGRLQEAERHLRHVVYLDPRHERAHVNLGRALLDQGPAARVDCRHPRRPGAAAELDRGQCQPRRRPPRPRGARRRRSAT